MAALLATRRADAWDVRLEPQASAAAASPERAQAEGRAVAWRLARTLGADPSPWDFEYQKAALGPHEAALGYAQMLAEACHGLPAANASVALPVLPGHADARTARSELAARGLPARGGRRWTSSLFDGAHFALAATLAFLAFAVYLLRVGRRGPAMPPMAEAEDNFALAVHGEWNTRTQHLLRDKALATASCVILLGRLKEPPAAVARFLQEEHGLQLPPLVQPLSLGAALRSLPHTLSLLAHGLRHAPALHYRPTLREHTAIAFRVILGSAMQAWWRMRGPGLRTVVFGHTGTADTNQLEQAMQARGTRTIHAVHGLATGPNFTGLSDVAAFRCGFDAREYTRLQVYGRCLVQEAPAPAPLRGSEGIYLLTNLAHPMNTGFAARGPDDELALLRLVAAAAELLGATGERRIWRPHPVIRRLPADVAARIRDEARSLGFEEQDVAEPIATAAARARWVMTSPSTTAVDLLGLGALPIVLDMQHNVAGTAPACFPTCGLEPALVARLLHELGDDAAYAERFRQTWEQVQPARPLDVGALLRAVS